MLSIGAVIGENSIYGTALELQAGRLAFKERFEIPFPPSESLALPSSETPAAALSEGGLDELEGPKGKESASSSQKAALGRRAAQIQASLQALKERFKGSPCRLCFALPQNLVSCFAASFPFSERFKIIKTLPFEIESRSLFQSEHVFFDVKLVPSEKGAAAVAFVALKESVKAFLQPLRAARARPFLVGAEGAALASLMEAGMQKAPESEGHSPFLIHLGLKSSFVLFFQSQRLKSVFSLKWSCQEILQNMGKEYKLSPQKALEQFQERAFVLTEARAAGKEQIFFSNMIQKSLMKLVKEVKLLCLSEEAPSSSTAYISGEGAVVKNLPAFLSLHLSKPCRRSRFMAALFPEQKAAAQTAATVAADDSASSESPASAASSKPLWSKEPLNPIPLGLALEGLRRPPLMGLNFIRSLEKRPPALFSLRVQIFPLALAFTLFAFYAAWRNQEAESLSDRAHNAFRESGKKIASMRSSQLSPEKAADFVQKQRLRAERAQRSRAFLSAPSAMDHLKAVSQGLKDFKKDRLKIRFLKIQGASVQIKGKIAPAAQSSFKARLKSLSLDGSVRPLLGDGKKKPAAAASAPAAAAAPAADGAESLSPAQAGPALELAEPSEGAASPPPSPPSPPPLASFALSFTLKEGL